MNKFAVLIFLASAQLLAQTKPENNILPNARIYEPKHLNGIRAEQVARFVQSMVGFVSIHWEPLVNGLTLKAELPLDAREAPQALDRAEALLKRFDVPPPPERQIEMTIHLIRAFAEGNPPTESMPPELASVVTEMKGALPYKGFKLADTIVMNIRDGLKVQEALPSAVSGMGGVSYFYSLEFLEPSVSADGKTFTVRGFRFGVKVPVTGLVNGYQDVSIATPLTIYQDQKQVLGKIKLSSMSTDDLFVVLSCKLR
jgi:hypothetical protein